MTNKDSRYRFLLENANVRGVLVRLDKTWQEALSRAEYPPNVQHLLGHAMAALPLMASTIKFSGKLTLQARGSGPVSLLVVQANAGGGQRGLAQWNSEPPLAPLSEIFGETTLSIQIDHGRSGEVYQGVVEVVGAGLQDALANYFQQSEQLPTRFWLHSDGTNASGLLLQQLPETAAATTPDEDSWQRVSMMADTITDEELSALPIDQLLSRVFSEDEVRLYDAEPLRFECGCSRKRTASLIEGLGHKEALEIVAEEGHIEIICEFCNSINVFDGIDVETIFRGGEESETIH